MRAPFPKKRSSSRYWRWAISRATSRAVPAVAAALNFYDGVIAPSKTGAKRIEASSGSDMLNLDANDRGFLERNGVRMDDELRWRIDCFLLREALVLGNLGDIVDLPSGRVVTNDYHLHRPYRSSLKRLRTIDLRGHACISLLSTPRGHRHIYCSLMNRISLLLMALEVPEIREQSLTVLVNPGLTTFQQDTFRLLAESGARIETVEVDRNSRVRCDRLVFVDYEADLGMNWGDIDYFPTPRHVCQRLRELILGGYAITPAPSEATYISRYDARARRVRNEPELRGAIEGAGATILSLSGLSFQKQVGAFARSSRVIASHGAGLTNLLFAPSSAEVIELHPDWATRWHYFVLSKVLGLRYRAIVGSVPDAKEDFTVDPDKLSGAIRGN